MRYAGPGVGSYAGLGSFLISEKRLIKPTKTGASPRSVQTKVEPEVVLAPKTTTKIPKAINPAEIRSANILSIFWSRPSVSPRQCADVALLGKPLRIGPGTVKDRCRSRMRKSAVSTRAKYVVLVCRSVSCARRDHSGGGSQVSWLVRGRCFSCNEALRRLS
jgi:hypothetical protein